ncbi:MAG: hypothetical protein WCC21_08235 [Candidatus Acidiferrales bacterium]
MSDSKIGRRFLAVAGLVASLSAVPPVGGNEPRLRQIPRSAWWVPEGALEDSSGKVVWEGQLGAEVSNLNGPVGIRSDNVRLRLGLESGEPAGAHPEYVVTCKSGWSESE